MVHTFFSVGALAGKKKNIVQQMYTNGRVKSLNIRDMLIY